MCTGATGADRSELWTVQLQAQEQCKYVNKKMDSAFGKRKWALPVDSAADSGQQRIVHSNIVNGHSRFTRRENSAGGKHR